MCLSSPQKVKHLLDCPILLSRAHTKQNDIASDYSPNSWNLKIKPIFVKMVEGGVNSSCGVPQGLRLSSTKWRRKKRGARPSRRRGAMGSGRPRSPSAFWGAISTGKATRTWWPCTARRRRARRATTAVQCLTQGRQAEGAGVRPPPRSLSFVPAVLEGDRGGPEPPPAYPGRSSAPRRRARSSRCEGRAPPRRSPSPPAATRASRRSEAGKWPGRPPRPSAGRGERRRGAGRRVRNGAGGAAATASCVAERAAQPRQMVRRGRQVSPSRRRLAALLAGCGRVGEGGSCRRPGFPLGNLEQLHLPGEGAEAILGGGRQAEPGGARCPSPGAAALRSPGGTSAGCVSPQNPPVCLNSESYKGKINISEGFGAEGRASGAGRGWKAMRMLHLPGRGRRRAGAGRPPGTGGRHGRRNGASPGTVPAASTHTHTPGCNTHTHTHKKRLQRVTCFIHPPGPTRVADPAGGGGQV